MNYCKACPLVVICVSRGLVRSWVGEAFNIPGLYLYECVVCHKIATRAYPENRTDNNLVFLERRIPKECTVFAYPLTCKCHGKQK